VNWRNTSNAIGYGSISSSEPADPKPKARASGAR